MKLRYDQLGPLTAIKKDKLRLVLQNDRASRVEQATIEIDETLLIPSVSELRRRVVSAGLQLDYREEVSLQRIASNLP